MDSSISPRRIFSICSHESMEFQEIIHSRDARGVNYFADDKRSTELATITVIKRDGIGIEKP